MSKVKRSDKKSQPTTKEQSEPVLQSLPETEDAEVVKAENNPNSVDDYPPIPDVPARTRKDQEDFFLKMCEHTLEKIADAMEDQVTHTSVKICETFPEPDAGLVAEQLTMQGYKVDFKDKKGADYRIMSISW